MDKKLTNMEMLIWGIKHIAENHNFVAYTDDWEEDLEVYILGNNVPTLSDVQMLCKDLGIPLEYIDSEYGIDVFLPEDWLKEKKDLPFKGMCFWGRADALRNIGLDIL